MLCVLRVVKGQTRDTVGGRKSLPPTLEGVFARAKVRNNTRHVGVNEIGTRVHKTATERPETGTARPDTDIATGVNEFNEIGPAKITALK